MAKRNNHQGRGAALKTEDMPGMIVKRDVRDAEVEHARCIQGFLLKTVKNHSQERT